MSYTTCATADTPSPNSRDILTCFLKKHCDDGLQHILLKAISGTKDDTPSSRARFEQLLAIFEELGLDIASVRRLVSMPDTVKLHCVRCHENYRPKNNGADACFIPHGEPECIRGGISCYTWEYSCCGLEQEGEYDDGLDGPPNPAGCFIGRHTEFEWEVKYNGDTCVECSKEDGCPVEEEEEDDEDDESEDEGE
ncbi:hypothetical protein B0H10DRAFT_2230468 [Mycena sp. CBHHK59/15]|nr:hypothetical protein B0H10DRAFT_2230468 [Mycena sp. CBHHK59/15]